MATNSKNGDDQSWNPDLQIFLVWGPIIAWFVLALAFGTYIILELLWKAILLAAQRMTPQTMSMLTCIVGYWVVLRLRRMWERAQVLRHKRSRSTFRHHGKHLLRLDKRQPKSASFRPKYTHHRPKGEEGGMSCR